MLRSALIATVPIVAVAVAFALAPRRDLSTEIEIAAPPSRVWAVLLDTRRYAQWNPSMRLFGSLTPGATIKNIEGRGADQTIFWPTVLTVRPDRELSWLGHYGFRGVFDAKHYFTLRPDLDGTEFTQGEHIRGVALWFYDVRQLLPVFAAVNTALKSRAETMSRKGSLSRY